MEAEMAQPTSGTFIATVKEFFPEVSDDEAMGILWNYTGYPSFWHGDPKGTLREQLQHLKDVGPEQVDRELDEALAE
jgi:hypothetical protein